jgi:DNA processing protein
LELRDLLLALNIDSALSLPELCRKFNIEPKRDDRLEILKNYLIQNSKSILGTHHLDHLEKELIIIKENHLKIITIFDRNYPLILKNIFDPPCLIYVKGSLVKSDLCSIAIVGSRRASFIGLNFAKNLSASLSMYGVTIVSGLARGIDSAAHQGALKVGGRTIAVLGSGFGYIYPATNKNLAQEISEKGAVISEFSYFTRPSRFNFPRRNRIISGLVLGVVVVEAAERSGSLITADFALEQGREVFAVPGFANTPNSKGTNRLIKQGAALVETESDIIESLPEHIKKYLSKRNSKAVIEKNLEKRHLNVYNLLTDEPLSVDTICQSLKLATNEALKILLDLQIKGLVIQLPGKLFCRK